MKNVSALVLIYDIRGFTAATRRMNVAEIGAFATKAHEAILDVFSARPPTFVKNLGDGHLLIWETDATPDPALLSDVVAGAGRARTAFTAFVAGHGAGGAALPKHVGIGVAYGLVSKSDDYYGVALNLAARLQNLARPEGLALDHRVFETVAQRDAALGAEFKRAKVRLKGLGSTTVFVRRPFSWARLLGRVGRVAAIVLLPVAYVALCDARLSLPLGDPVRRFLDRFDASVFRRPRSTEEVFETADGLRGDLAKALFGARSPGGWIASDMEGKTVADLDVWSSSQSLCALFGESGLSMADVRPLLEGLAVAFDAKNFVRAPDGTPYGWLAHPGTAYTEAEPLFWTIAALARALRGVVPDARRTEFLGYLALAEDASRLHHPIESGGWNMYPNQRKPDGHSPYTTTLAFLALLEVRSARLPWWGSVERRDALLASTAAWLAGSFVETGPSKGWRRTQDPLDVVSRGLTDQIYALLLRAEAEAGTPVPEPILRAASAEVRSLDRVSLEATSADAGEFSIDFHAHDAKPTASGELSWTKGTEGINFLWHPWAVATARALLDRAARPAAGPGFEPEEVVGIRRALGWLVVDLAPQIRETCLTGYTFMAAETLYGLQTIRGTDRR